MSVRHTIDGWKASEETKDVYRKEHDNLAMELYQKKITPKEYKELYDIARSNMYNNRYHYNKTKKSMRI